MPIKFTTRSANAATCASGYVVVGVYGNKDFTSSAKELNEKTSGAIATVIANKDLNGEVGSCAILPLVTGIKAKRIVVMQLGPRKEFNQSQFNKAVKAVAGRLAKLDPGTVTVFVSDIELDNRGSDWIARRVVEIFSQQLYKFDQLKKDDKKSKKQWQVQVAVNSRTELPAIKSGTTIGEAIAQGVRLSMDLGNLPGNICTPTYLADTAKDLERYENLEVTVLEEAEMAELGMHSLLSVSRGSREPAKLIIMNYSGDPSGSAPLALVGKGLTFDAGGISIKPAGAMDEMKFDMCGGAGVIGAMQAIASLRLPVNVIGTVASSENLPDGAANKPGDIVKSMAGLTIEILNTDAEGRLILCDALTYIDRYKPQTVIDAATLTGACVIALGKHASGLFSNCDELAQEIIEAGITSDDRAWHMPLWEEYQQQLKSNFADMANIGGRDAGAVTAACFLARFTEQYRWAHLDIAGTAWNTGSDKGSTGRPVGLFVQYVLNHLEANR